MGNIAIGSGGEKTLVKMGKIGALANLELRICGKKMVKAPLYEHMPSSGTTDGQERSKTSQKFTKIV
jgi:hypothetical protein